jgi:fused signal recognition particle receptor
MGFFSRFKEGLAESRQRFREDLNLFLEAGVELDDEFWDALEEALITTDIGARAADQIVYNIKTESMRKALPDVKAVMATLNDQIAAQFVEDEKGILAGGPAVLVFVGVNGSGKTTTVGKLAKEATDAGRKAIMGSADTFRAAAIEQLEEWAERAGVEICARTRGSDPASVCYETIERAEAIGADLVLIDTAGRLHTSADLMRELQKVVSVVRKRSTLPVYVVLVIDATTGRNGLAQAVEFNNELELDGLVVTKLDGTAKGGIALAISQQLGLPIIKLGVGERLDDLKDFDAHEYAAGLVGDFDEEAHA